MHINPSSSIRSPLSALLPCSLHSFLHLRYRFRADLTYTLLSRCDLYDILSTLLCTHCLTALVYCATSGMLFEVFMLMICGLYQAGTGLGVVYVYIIYISSGSSPFIDVMMVKASSPRSMVFSVSGVASPLGFHDLRKRKQIS